MPRFDILLLVREYARELSYYDDWREAFLKHANFRVDVENIGCREALPRIRDKIRRAPFVISLHSTIADGTAAFVPLADALQARQGIFVAFVGNEVNLPDAPMAEKIAFLQRTAPDAILTQLLPEAGAWLYAPVKGARVFSLPHALNPEAFPPGPPLTGRRIDIGARSHRYTIHIGDDLRTRLHDFFTRHCAEFGLACDIELGGRRFDRAGWSAFLQRCKATISTEAGSDFLHRDDALVEEVQQMLRAHAGRHVVMSRESLPRRLARKLLPMGAKTFLVRALRPVMVRDDDMDTLLDEEERREILNRVFTPDRKAPFHTKVISSRHFDAIGTRTCQIMTPGRYNDILQADVHYIAIAPDFSNIDSVLERLRDENYCQRLVDTTREYVLDCHTYAHRMARLEEILEEIA